MGTLQLTAPVVLNTSMPMAGEIPRRLVLLLLATLAWCPTATASENGSAGPAQHGESDERLVRLALDIQRYRLPSGLSVVLNPERSVSTVAICMSFPNQRRSLPAKDQWSAQLLQLARYENLNVSPSVARQLGWRSLSEERDLGWDVVSFSRVVPAYDLEFGVWTAAQQSRNSPPRALTTLRRALLLDARASNADLDRRAIDWLREDTPSNSLEALETLSLDAVSVLARDFWPESEAVLTLSGGFETEQARAFVQRYFSSEARNEADGPEFGARRAAPRGERTSRRARWATNLSKVFLGFAIPAVDHPDHPALKLLAGMLGTSTLGGHHGPLASLADIHAWTGDTAGSDLLTLEAPVSNARQAATVEHRVLGLLRSIAAHPPAPKLLADAVERERIEFWQRFESPARRALWLSQAEARRGDARLALRDVSRVERVRPEDISRVASRYLMAGRYSMLLAVPGGAN